QRRNDAVHRRHRRPGLTLLNLEPPDIIRGCRIGRAAQKAGKAPDIAEVIALRRPRETAHLHILNHPLAQIDRCRRGNRLGHGWLLCNERSQHPQTGPPKPSNKTYTPSAAAALNTSTIPAQRVSSSADTGATRF